MVGFVGFWGGRKLVYPKGHCWWVLFFRGVEGMGLWEFDWNGMRLFIHIWIR